MLGVSHAVQNAKKLWKFAQSVIGEVLELDRLVVVYEIPYSSCIFNTAAVLEPGTMVCAYHTAVYLVHRSCLCYTI